MSETPTLMTADELLVYPHDDKRMELVDGVLHVMEPGNAGHGGVAATLLGLLWAHVRAHDLGRVFAAETGFVLARDPDTVRAPDVGFVTKARADLVPRSRQKFWEGPPDLAIEVRSPRDSGPKVEDKVAAWLAAGTPLVLVADISSETVTSHRPGQTPLVALTGDMVDAGDVVPGWTLEVAEVFA